MLRQTARTPLRPSPEISVCVPMYNEEDNVRPLHEAIVTALEPMGRSFEILLVDDGSSDDTIPRMIQLAAEDPRVVVVRFQRNYGQTAAMMAGIDHARGRFLVTMDGDLQNDPLDIPMMLDKLEEGHDLVVGHRLKRQDKFLTRKVPSKVANWLIGKVVGLPIRDNGCSLKVYRAEVIKRVSLYSDMHRFIPAMTTPMGARVAQVGVRHHARRFGVSKYGLSRVFKVLLDLITIKTLQVFSRHPLARFSGLAAMGAALAVAAAVTMQGENLVVEAAVVGLLVALAVFLMCLGLISGVIFMDVSADDH